LSKNMTGTVLIRPVGEDEREAWNPLWAGYLAFYKTALARDVSDLTWTRFHDPDEPMFALGGYVDGRLAGFAHYLFHRSTTRVEPTCYLQDLYVDEVARGLGVGAALIDATHERARDAGAARLYWQTHETNAVARALYEKVADRTGFIVYARAM